MAKGFNFKNRAKDKDLNNDYIPNFTDKYSPSYIPEICFTVKDLYISPTNHTMSIVNKDKTKVKSLLDAEQIKPITDEVPVLDLICNEIQTDLPPIILNSLRGFFGITKKAGFSESFRYGYADPKDINNLYTLASLMHFQEDLTQQEDFINF